MKNLVKVYILMELAASFFFYSCKYNKQGKTNKNFQFTIRVQDKKKINEYKQLIDSSRYIPLETDSNSIFGEIYKIEIWNDTIIILDKKNKLLLTFDMNGKFLKKIGQQGRCPWCFKTIDDIAIDREHDQICILDTRQNKILKYSLDGVYNGLEAIPSIFPYGFAYDKGYKIYAMRRYPSSYRNESLYYDLLVAKNQQLIREYFPFNKDTHSGTSFSNALYYEQDTLNFIRFREGEVYAITKDEATGRFNIDFGKNQLPKKYMQYGASPQKKYAKPYSYLFGNIVESKKYIYFSYIEKQKIKFGIYLKPKHQFYSLKPQTFLFTLFRPIYCYHNAFVSVIEPYLIINYGSRTKDNIVKNLSKQLKDYDNPVLVLHYTK